MGFQTAGFGTLFQPGRLDSRKFAEIGYQLLVLVEKRTVVRCNHLIQVRRVTDSRPYWFFEYKADESMHIRNVKV